MTLLILGVSPNMTTGYGKVGKYLIRELQKRKADFYYLGLQCRGKQELPLLPIFIDIYANGALQYYIRKYKVTELITIGDTWDGNFAYVAEVAKAFLVTWIVHVTANTRECPNVVIDYVRRADHVVAPSRFVQGLLEKKGVKSTFIPHGVELSIFKPVTENVKKLIKKNQGFENNFVFCSVGTNKLFQKGWIELFRGFKIFKEKYDKENVCVLFCHTEVSSADGYNLNEYARKLGIQDHIIFPSDHQRDVSKSDEEMSGLYQLSDCYITASLGESFGMPIVEAMACGLPVIGTDFSAVKDHIDDSGAGLLVKIKHWMTAPIVHEDQAIIDSDDLAEKMNIIFSDKKLRDDLSRKAVVYAQNFGWASIGDQWFKLVSEAHENPPMSYTKGFLGV